MSQNKNVLRQDLIRHIARTTGVTKRTAAEMISSFESLVIAELVAGRSITLTGFGTFYASQRKSRRGINPNTKASLKVPAMVTPRFRAGARFKSALRKETS